VQVAGLVAPPGTWVLRFFRVRSTEDSTVDRLRRVPHRTSFMAMEKVSQVSVKMARPNQSTLGQMVAFCFRNESRKKGLKSGVGEGNKWWLLAVGWEGWEHNCNCNCQCCRVTIAASNIIITSNRWLQSFVASFFSSEFSPALSLGLSLSAYNRFILRRELLPSARFVFVRLSWFAASIPVRIPRLGHSVTRSLSK
jgi:hypothetical protein